MKDTDKKFRKKTTRPYDPVKAEQMEKRAALANRFSIPITALFCVIGYFLIETMARHSFAGAWSFLLSRPAVFFFNVALIFITTLPVYLLRRRFFYRVFIAAVWLGLGAADGIVLANRVTPLTGPDFMMGKEAVSIVRLYLTDAEIVLICVVFVLALAALIRFYFRSPKFKGRMYRKLALFACILGVAGFGGLTQVMLRTRQISNYFSNIAFAYQDYGFPYCLTVTLLDQGISTPRSYSQRLVNNVIKREGEIPESQITEDMPNIIVVQLESFFDTSRVRWLRTSEDPLSNWHALSKEYSSGYYTVPTVGAGTVNTEFEVLTGMSLRFFGAGEYPYKGILLKGPCESAAYDLAELGYSTHAIHNNEASFYGRPNVYQNLGFETFTSEEYMNTQTDVNENGWMRDRNLTKEIFNCLESSDERDFVFTVSVQAHGSYPTEDDGRENAITVSGAMTEEKKCSWEYYINQIYEVDQFVGNLTKRLENYEEPTIVLFYGDHLPTLGLTHRDLKKGTTFETNYLIWSNFELERKTKRLTSYQAVAELLSRIDLHVGTMFNFNQTMRGRRDYFYNMQILQYDLLYGEKYALGGDAERFQTMELQMGVDPILFTGIRRVGDSDTYMIDGENFTQSCAIQVNGTSVDTSYFSNAVLLTRGFDLKDGDTVSLVVIGSDQGGGILETVGEIVYREASDMESDGNGTSVTTLVPGETAFVAPDPDAVLTAS